MNFNRKWMMIWEKLLRMIWEKIRKKKIRKTITINNSIYIKCNSSNKDRAKESDSDTFYFLYKSNKFILLIFIYFSVNR